MAAQLAEMSVEDFKALNASFNRPVILGEHEPTLLLPTDRADIFKANLEAYQGKLSSWQAYHARQGESYAAIAKKYGISLENLRKINGLSSKKTKAVAQTLLVPNLENGGGIQLASLEYPSNDNAVAGKPSIKKASVQRRGRDIVVQRKVNVRTHTVQSGDTLYSLAKRYHTSVDELRKLNNLKSNGLSRGKQLRVPGTNIRG